MRRFKALGQVAVTALAAVITCAPLAQAAAPDLGTSRRGGDEKVIELVDILRDSTLIDQDPPGLSLGDEAVGNGELFQNDQSVGSEGFVCTVVSLQPDLRECEVTLRLAKGDITLQGLAPVISGFPTNFTLAITGGTGIYRNASGFVNGTNVNDTETDLTLHLSDVRGND